METAYDQTKYESYAYSQTHPQHLFTLGKLFGTHPTDFKDAKILELGTASGGNLIPIAYNLPNSQFIGIDLSSKQIADGTHLIQTLNLKNIELKAISIADVDASFGTFDYIICHGIYSWVPQAIQDQILRIFQENLSSNGIAYLSYNTLPGWSMVKSIRDMMLYHTQNYADPAIKAQQARALLQFLVEGLEGENTSYADFLRHEIEILRNQPDSYLLHDHLEEVNQPYYFYQIIEKSQQFGLSYLADCNLVSMFVGNLPPQFAQELGKVKNIVTTNQYMDFIRNQRFRATLFCHDSIKIQRNIQSNAIQNFYLSYGGTPINLTEADLKEGVEVKFIGHNITLTTSQNIAKMCFYILIQAKQSILYKDLVAKIQENINLEIKQIENYLNNDLNLMRLTLGGLIKIQSMHSDYVTKISERPRTTVLAVEQSKVKNYVTNQNHQTIFLNPFEKIILQLLNGDNNKDSIVQELLAKLEMGSFTLLDDQKKHIQDKHKQIKYLENLYLKTMEKLANNALLI